MRNRPVDWTAMALLAFGLTWVAPRPAAAQPPPGSEEDLYQDPYADQEVYEADRFAIGFGAGIVLVDDNRGNDDGEIYYSANFRWRVLGRDGRRRDRDAGDYNQQHNQRHYRGRYPAGYNPGGGIQGYLEPEIAYWKRSGDGSTAEDLLLGLNLVGVVPTRNADFFLGVGFGFHNFDGELLVRDDAGRQVDRVDLSKDRIGGNLQVGVEIYLTSSLGIFGTGRLDILEDEPFDRQTKIWGGLRAHF